MKTKILGLLTVAALGLGTLTASAQQYGVAATLLSAGIVDSPFTGSSYQSNYTAVTLTKYQEAYISLAAFPSNTSSGQIKVVWSLSADGSKYANQGSSATNYVTLSVGTAADQINWGTNIYVGSAGYLKVGIIGATNSVLTNVTLKAYTKPVRHGS